MIERLPDIETVASRVHENWVTRQRAQGYTSLLDPVTGEEQLRLYSQLSEERQQVTRESVGEVYQAIEELSEEGGS